MSTFALAPVQGSHSTMSAKGKKATSLERQLLAARSGRWDVRLRFRWLSLAEPSSNFPMMDWNEKLVFSNSW
jgi:hypothetical protein